MARPAPTEKLPKARKLYADKLVIDDSKLSITFQIDSEAMPQAVELAAVNAETGAEIRVPMATNSKPQPSVEANRWRNTSKVGPEAIAAELTPGQWRCYLLIDGTVLYRLFPPEGLLEEPITLSADLTEMTFHRSAIGLLIVDIAQRELSPARDLQVVAENIWTGDDNLLRLAANVTLFEKPLSGSLCELEIRSRDGKRVVQRIALNPSRGRFEAALPASLPLGIHDVFLNLPALEAAVRIRYPEMPGDSEAGATVLGPDQSAPGVSPYRTKGGALSLYVAPAPAQFEITRIQSTQTTFMLSGVVAGSEESDKTAKRVLDNYKCFAVGRDTGDEIELGVVFDGGTFHIKFAIQSLPDADFGIWDIAMKSPRGDLSFLSPNDESRADARMPAVCSSVAGAAAVVECLSSSPDRVTLAVEPLLRGSRLDRLAIGNSIEAVFEIETRDIPVANLFNNCRTALLVSFGTTTAHRMPSRTMFTPTGPFTCRITLHCELAGAPPDQLRKVIANCSLGIAFAGPNINGAAPLDSDDSKIVSRGLRAMLEKPWTKVRGEQSAERLYRRMLRWLKVDPDTALFENSGGEGYAGNPRAISQEMAKTAPHIKQTWILKDPAQLVPNAQNVVRPGTLAYYRHLTISRYIIGNTALPAFVEKRPGTVHIQTTLEIPEGEGPLASASSLSRWDMVLSPNSYATGRLRQLLDFRGEIVEIGNPRNDLLLDASDRAATAARVRKELNIPENKRIILYAPERHRSRPPISLYGLKRALGNDHVLLLRLPPDVANSFEWLDGYGGFAVNVSKYEAMTDLLCAADVFVTDTSQTMVDFALTGKPMLFYVRDTEGIDNIFADVAPGPVLRKQSSLTRALLKGDDQSGKVAEKYRSFVENYCASEHGNAAQVALARLLTLGGGHGTISGGTGNGKTP